MLMHGLHCHFLSPSLLPLRPRQSSLRFSSADFTAASLAAAAQAASAAQQLGVSVSLPSAATAAIAAQAAATSPAAAAALQAPPLPKYSWSSTLYYTYNTW